MKLPGVVLAITASLFFYLPALSLAKSMQVEEYTFSELKVEQENNLIVVSGYVEGRPRCYALSVKIIFLHWGRAYSSERRMAILFALAPLRSAQSRTAVGICDKRVLSFAVAARDS